MAKAIFEGLTMKQAKTLVEWYEGQGEQDADIWFDIHGVPTPFADCGRKGSCMEVDKKNETVTLYCKTNE